MRVDMTFALEHDGSADLWPLHVNACAARAVLGRLGATVVLIGASETQCQSSRAVTTLVGSLIWPSYTP
jgi:hypothetical protein